MSTPISSSTSTLASPHVASLITRLFADADAVDGRLRARLAALPVAERERFMAEARSDYRRFYGSAKDLYLAVSPDTARLSYALARMNGARALVEFGTSFGISTIHLAAALRDNGGGTLIGSELEPDKAAVALHNLEEAGLADLVDVRVGDALDTLARDLPERIDGVLLDGHKPLYAAILDRLEARLRPGAFIIADNVDACPEYVARVRADGSGYVSVAFAEDVELTIRV